MVLTLSCAQDVTFGGGLFSYTTSPQTIYRSTQPTRPSPYSLYIHLSMVGWLVMACAIGHPKIALLPQSIISSIISLIICNEGKKKMNIPNPLPN